MARKATRSTKNQAGDGGPRQETTPLAIDQVGNKLPKGFPAKTASHSTDADAVVTVPSVVVAEWWRGQKGPAARLLDAFTVEPTSRALAKVAGEALAELRLGGEHTSDGLVMASAAGRGDVVYTSDFNDLSPDDVLSQRARARGLRSTHLVVSIGGSDALLNSDLLNTPVRSTRGRLPQAGPVYVG